VVRRDSLVKAGYLIALLLVLVPLLDAGIRTGRVRLGDEGWRFGTLGILFNTLVTPLLGVFLAMVVATQLEHRRVLKVVAGVVGVAAGLAVIALGGFVLDYVQLRGSVTPEGMGAFDIAARKAMVVGVLGVGTAVVLAVSGWRTARRLPETRRGDDRNIGLVSAKEERA
jgi:hypothetical protein